MSHIVVLGAGIGGVPAAYDLRKELSKEHQVTLVNKGEKFFFTPSNPWAAVGWSKSEKISVDLTKYMKKKKIDFKPSGAKTIDAENNKMILDNGEVVEYDYLVITTGPKLAFHEVPGLGPIDGHTQSICTLEHSETAWEEYQKFLENPGPIVVGAVQGASCYGPAYEFAMILDTDLRKRGIRDKVPMTFVTAEPYVGHLGLGGVGDSKGLMESEMRDRHIKWITNAKVDKVEAGKMFVTEVDDKGEDYKSHELDFGFSMMLPAFLGVDAVMDVEGLNNPRGFVLIDEHQRNPKFKNIYSAGVCVAIPPVEPTPVATGAPKTGYMIESMVTATAKNIKAELEGKEPYAKATWNAICLADLGDTGVAFVALPQIPPRNTTWAKKGKWVHLAKIAFEKYFMRKIKTGSTDSLFERYVLGMMKIKRLKEK
jgi:sulfide:quinone oxidoreductase